MATEDKLLNGAGLSRLASDIKGYVADQSEVYVGPSAPVSGNYKIWIDTNEVGSDFLKSGDNVSELVNDSGYVTSSYHDSTKQNVLTAGSNINITNNTISATYNDATTSASGLMSAADKTKLNGVQNGATAVSVSASGTSTDEVQYITINGTEKKLAGGGGEPAQYIKNATATSTTLTLTKKDDSIVTFTPTGGSEPAAYLKTAAVSGNTLTLTNKDNSQVVFTPTGGTTYTAGSNIQISPQNVISATDTTYSAGSGISIVGNVITNTGQGATYTAGNNVQISDQNVISATDTTYTAGTNIVIDANNVISANGGAAYTAGNNIQISDQNVISATDTVYTAGSNISISNNAISATIPNASSSVVGGIKMRLSGTSLYITNDGTTP